MSSMQSNSEISDLQEILRLQQGLQDITDCINAAQNVKQIILDSRPMILKLFNVEASHIYVVNTKNKKEARDLRKGNIIKRIDGITF